MKIFQTKKPTAQEIQDEIFKNMTMDEKIAVWARFWQLPESFKKAKIDKQVLVEDLILIKLQWNKESPSSRYIEDVESIFKISGDLLDREYLRKWAKELGVEDELGKFLN